MAHQVHGLLMQMEQRHGSLMISGWICLNMWYIQCKNPLETGIIYRKYPGEIVG